MTTVDRDDSTVPVESDGVTTGGGNGKWRGLHRFLVPAILLGLVIVAYAVSVPAPTLLDEAFLLRWAAENPAAVLGWKGFSPADLWGPLPGLSISGLSSLVPAQRIFSIVVHYGTAVFLFLLLRRLSFSVAVSTIAASLFAVFPLASESVSWLGGRGMLLGTFFFAASAWSYLRFRNYGTDLNKSQSRPSWIWLAPSLACFALALLSSASLWVGCLVIACFEIFGVIFRAPHERKDPTVAMAGLIGFIVITAAYGAGTGILNAAVLGNARPELSASALYQSFHQMLFPIKKAIWHGYAAQFRILYFLLPPVLLALLVSLRMKDNLKRVGLCLVWLLVALVPALGHASGSTTLFGERFLYPALMPFLALLAIGPGSLVEAGLLPGSRPKAKLMTGLGAVLALALLLFYVPHIWNQNKAFKVSGRRSESIMKSVGIAGAKQPNPVLILTDLPDYLSHAPGVLHNNAGVFDVKSHLVASSFLPAGRFKDELASGNFRDSAIRWDREFHILVGLDLTPEKNTFPQSLNAVEIADKLTPQIELFKGVKLLKEENLLLLDSNSQAGPAVRIEGDGVSTICGDFICVEARIDAPPELVKPTVDLYWQTHIHRDYDDKLRHSSAPALINDRSYHRYYLPLRSLAWTTSGPPFLLTFGFPAGSRVWLKSIGMQEDGSDRLPVLQPAKDLPAVQSPAPQAFPPFYNFPNIPQLGLLVASEQLALNYSVEKIPGSVGVLVEISQPNERFANPNGTEVSSVSLRTTKLTGTTGNIVLNRQDLVGDGIYSVRVIAVDVNGNFIGNFSDEICCLFRMGR